MSTAGQRNFIEQLPHFSANSYFFAFPVNYPVNGTIKRKKRLYGGLKLVECALTTQRTELLYEFREF